MVSGINLLGVEFACRQCTLQLVLYALVALALAMTLASFWAVAGALSFSFGRNPLARILWLLIFLSLSEWTRGFVATGFPMEFNW